LIYRSISYRNIVQYLLTQAYQVATVKQYGRQAD